MYLKGEKPKEKIGILRRKRNNMARGRPNPTTIYEATNAILKKEVAERDN